jgi:soluble lytic murein transglycosylase
MLRFLFASVARRRSPLCALCFLLGASIFGGAGLNRPAFAQESANAPATPSKKHSTLHHPVRHGHPASRITHGSKAVAYGHSAKTAHRRRSSVHPKRRHVSARTLARVHELHHAFVASSQLRPMAQQLMTDRTPEAYAGVLHYARTHTGEAASAAYMALGQAYFVDGKFPQSAAAYRQASQAGVALADYADYLGAQADFSQHDYATAQQRLQNFGARHADSILVGPATLLMANIQLGQNDPQAALRELAKLHGSPIDNSSKYLFTLGRADQMAGDRKAAQEVFTRIYTEYPISNEAAQVADQLRQMGVTAPFTAAQRSRHAGGLYLAGRYAEAAAAYRSLAEDPAYAGTPRANEMLARAAVASYKQTHHVDMSLLNRLPDSNDETGATRLYLSLEQARDSKDVQQVKALIDQMEQRFPTSRWTAEALFSAGNMSLVANDVPSAIQFYGDLAQRFPDSSMAPTAHWHAAWLNYRLGDKKTAGKMLDDQIVRYPREMHVAAAIYWRGVIYQEVESNPAAATACYRKVVSAFHHYYYADLARQRLAALHASPLADEEAPTLPQLARVADPEVPELTDQVPQDEVHVERAQLLANAGLNQYIVPEIAASPDSSTWRAYAEAQLYSSYGENWRAMRVLKQKVRSYFSIPIASLPRSYWNLLFPQPYWPTLLRNSQQQGLDPYLVASLIRQESEFNPSVVSYANAWGLMQLLPRVGKGLAKQERVRPFRTAYLLNPDVNLKLGAVYLRELMNEFQGQPEYALAAYNAGDDRVKTWLANGPYASLPEFVESIPFTQTREYVQAILRNREIYRKLYGGD